jgi:hypothetical protein
MSNHYRPWRTKERKHFKKHKHPEDPSLPTG